MNTFTVIIYFIKVNFRANKIKKIDEITCKRRYNTFMHIKIKKMHLSNKPWVSLRKTTKKETKVKVKRFYARNKTKIFRKCMKKYKKRFLKKKKITRKLSPSEAKKYVHHTDLSAHFINLHIIRLLVNNE